MDADRKIRLGIIGAGKTASWHLKAYRKIKEAEIVAVSNPSSERGLRLAEKYGIKNHFRDYNGLLDYCNLDAVDICAPTGLHKEMIVAALKKGLHVYVEKPMCRTLEEADQIVQMNKFCKRVIFNGFNYRFWPEIKRIKEIIDSGRLGKVRFVKIVRTLRNPASYLLDPKIGGGVINEIACHFIDLLQWWGLKDLQKVCSHGTNLLDGEITPDTVSVNLEYKDGSQALIVKSLGILGIYPEILIAGTRGALRLKYGKILIDSNRKYSLFESIIFAFRESMVIPYRILRNPFNGSCRHFIDCVRGVKNNEMNEESAREVIKITDLAYRSFLEKRTMSVL